MIEFDLEMRVERFREDSCFYKMEKMEEEKRKVLCACNVPITKL